MTHPVLLDVSTLFGATPDEVVIGLARATPSDGGFVRFVGGRVAGVGRASVEARLAALARRANRIEADCDATIAWLRGDSASARAPEVHRGLARLGDALRFTPSTAPPSGAVLLKPGLAGWSDPRFADWLVARPGLKVIAILDDPFWLEAPEYAAAETVEQMRRELECISRLAHLAAAPTETARGRLAAALAGSDLPIFVLPRPSQLAGSRPAPPPDRVADPYWIAPLPLEAGRNAALLLHIWRDMAHQGGDVPKLVLTGARGSRIERIRPLLEWSEPLRPYVREAPHLSATNLRRLACGARGVLLPAFVEETGALARDLADLGVHVVAADLPIFREALAGRGRLLEPIDGVGWRAAIARAAAAPSCNDATLPDWAAFFRGLTQCAEDRGRREPV